MRILVLITSYLILSFVNVFGQINTGSPAIPFGSKIATVVNPYANGIVPTNLPTGTYAPASGQYGKSQDAADAYNTWKTNYTAACGSNVRVKFDTPSQTVSEGTGYGMLLAAYAGDKTLFDGLWGYYKANTDGNGLMNWRTGSCTPDQSGGATDADLDAAMALLVAKCQWPSATSPYIYNTEANTLITAIKNAEIHNTSFQAINGDGWGFGNNCRNPSYQSPAYYRQFAAQIPAQATTWNSAVTAAYNLLNANRNTTTGLISNWSDQNGVPNNCNGNNEYGYDACRNPWRMAVDVLWYGNSTAQTNFCVPIAAYVNGKGASNAGAPIPQAGGTGLVEASFTSTFAAGICGSNATYQTIMNSMYTQTLNTTDALPRYFGNTLRVLSLFVQTGNFWQPCNPAPLTVSVSLTAPTNNQTFNEGDVIALTATASTTNGSITKVEFYNGTILIGTATNSPYTISWANAPSGTNQLIAKAYNSNSETASTIATPIFVVKAVNQTPTVPLIDGTGWTGTTSASLNTLIAGTVTDATDLSATYKAMWDATNFYLLVNVTDDVKVNNGGTDYYNDDAVEVFFNIGNVPATSYGVNDFQYTFRWNDNKVYEQNNKTTNVTFSRVDNATGYVMQMTFPWATLKGTPTINQLVGFDVEVDDDDDGGSRDGKISWAASADQAWTDPSYMGTVILKGILCNNPSAAGTITGVATTCAGTAGITYSITSVSGATGYTWTVPSDATITAGANTNSITVTFGTASGNITVTPTNTCGSGASSSLTVTLTAPVIPAVTIASVPATSICSGSSVTFTASPANGGTPTYQWRNNGINITGATGTTYTTAALADGDKIDVIMISTATCRSANMATSSQVTVAVNPNLLPSVTVSTPATTICSSTSVTFTATPTNGGTPTYQWRNNGINITGATGTIYTTAALADGDKIDVIMTSTATCRSTNTATSNPLTMSVTAIVPVSVTISAPTSTICAGTNITFTASPVNGGTPIYQWRDNGTNVTGATGATYTSATLANGDKVDVIMTSTATCRSSNTATSAQTTIVVNAAVTPSVTIAASTATSVCAGTNVVFTATPQNGGTPTYQWRNNNIAIPGATGVTYAVSTLANGDKIDVIMTSTANCRSANTATSAKIAMTVTATIDPSVVISVPATTICAGTSITFTAAPKNGGTPTYQWRNNGVAINGATAATYTSATLSDEDAIDVVMTSTAICRSSNTSTSNILAMTINAAVAPSVTVNASQTTICTGSNVTFSATPAYGGTPTYQWQKNGTNISGATSDTYSTATISNADVFDVVMTSNAICRTGNIATSNKITMIISTSVQASVNIDVTPVSTIYAGQTVTFTANSVNGGTPTYQWRNNGVIIPGEVNTTYETNTLTDESTISVTMTSTVNCVSTATVNSNTITMTVKPNPAFDNGITGPSAVSSNQSNVTYSVTNSSGMQYQWTLPSGATIISGQGTNSIVINFGNSNGNVTVIETNPVGQTAIISIPVSVETTTAIIAPETETNVLVYPVPCTDYFTIDMSSSTEENITYTLIDATGNTIRTGTIRYAGNPVQLQTDFAAGVYILMLYWNEKSVLKRITKM